MPTIDWTLTAQSANSQTWSSRGRSNFGYVPPVGQELGDSIMFGTSSGGYDQSFYDDVYANYNNTHKSIRVFDGGLPTSYNSSNIAHVRHSWPIPIVVHSMKSGINSSTASGSVDSELEAFVDSFPVVSGRTWYLTLHHEPENDVTSGIATYASHYRSLNSRYADIIHNAGRSDIKHCTILMGYTLAARNPEDWYVPEADALGWDSYHYPHVINSRDYSKSKNKPWIHAELGNKPNDNTDSELRTVLQSFTDSYLDESVSWPPIAAQYFHATKGGPYPLFPTAQTFNGLSIPARPLSWQYWVDLQSGQWRDYHS
jgi:hypothetical protein